MSGWLRGPPMSPPSYFPIERSTGEHITILDGVAPEICEVPAESVACDRTRGGSQLRRQAARLTAIGVSVSERTFFAGLNRNIRATINRSATTYGVRIS